MSQTQLSLVVDKSGSMAFQANAASGAINALIERQKSEPGSCYLLLNEFSDKVQKVYSGPIQKAPQYFMTSNGNTSLNDAIVETLNTTAARIKKTSVKARPQLVICVIVTDGGENTSSRRIAETRQRVQDALTSGWQIIYLCQDRNSASYAANLGIQNVQVYSQNKTQQVYEATNSLVARMREDSREGRAIRNSFTAKEVSSYS